MRPKIFIAAGLLLLGIAWFTSRQWSSPATASVASMDGKLKRSSGSSHLELAATKPPAVQRSSIMDRPPLEGLNEQQAAQLQILTELQERDDGSADLALDPLREWATKNPEACLKWILENLQGSAKQRSLEEAIAVWAARSPEDAIAWFDRQPTAETLEGPISAAFAALANKDVSASAKWLEAHPDSASRENYQILISAWGASDSPDSLAWVEQKLPPTMKDVLLPDLLASFRSPEATDSLLKDVGPETHDSALNTAIDSVLHSEPEFALTLASRLRDKDAYKRAVESILTQWREIDSNSAQAWVAQHLPPATTN